VGLWELSALDNWQVRAQHKYEVHALSDHVDFPTMSLIFGRSYKGWNYHGEDGPLAMHATIDFILTHVASCI
jgi:hypothetical protein